MDISTVYPYLVTKDYPPSVAGFEQEIGHGIRVTVVANVGGLIRSLKAADIESLGLSWDKILNRSIENLDRLAHDRVIGMQLFENGPAELPFLLAGGHWGAAALIIAPRFRMAAVGALQTEEVCVSIPHREALIAFPKGDRLSRSAMMAMVRKNEAEGEKPLTWELFELKETAPVPFEE
jgi:hypothetical protein